MSGTVFAATFIERAKFATTRNTAHIGAVSVSMLRRTKETATQARVSQLYHFSGFVNSMPRALKILVITANFKRVIIVFAFASSRRFGNPCYLRTSSYSEKSPFPVSSFGSIIRRRATATNVRFNGSRLTGTLCLCRTTKRKVL